jgi:hypothetical protein
LHPFFVSVIDITHNPKERSIEMSVRIFNEDLEKTLQKYTTTKIDILQPVNRAVVNEEIQKYISKHLTVIVNGKPISYKIIGFEQQKESTWCYFEALNINSANTVGIDCDILYDLENTQVNIIHVKSKGTEKTYKLDYPNKTANFTF